MTSAERREARYERRKEKRLRNREKRSEEVGGIDSVFGFCDFFKLGHVCCDAVRWKASIQKFEVKLFTETARTRGMILSGTWKPSRFNSFSLTERGKTRPIDAPTVQDRQVHKAFTRNVLLRLYPPSMINDNGASLKGKGFRFSVEELKHQLRRHFKLYGREGYIALLDFERFFPSASQSAIIGRHEKYILDDRLRDVGDRIIKAKKGGVGVPLGVEASQIEMIALPSGLDNYIRCGLHLPLSGHYMDDYHVIVPPGTDVEALIDDIIRRAAEDGLTVNKAKTKVIPLTRPFRYCKAKYFLSENGVVKVHGNIRSFRVAKRKIKAFKGKLERGEMTKEDAHNSVQASIAYFKQYDNHGKVLRLRRMCHAVLEV